MEPSRDILIKVVLVGDFDVGKTCLLNQFTERSFSSLYTTTIGTDIKVRTLNVDGLTVKLQIWDTAGQERFKTLTRTYYRQAKAAMLVYSVTNEKSFQDVRDWISDINEIAGHNVVKIVVGNKTDNPPDMRAVSYERGRKLGAEYECEFVEVSAKTGINVEEAFMTLARSYLTSRRLLESGADSEEQQTVVVKTRSLKRSPDSTKMSPAKKRGCC